MKTLSLTSGHQVLLDDEDYDRITKSGFWQPLVDKYTTYARRSFTLCSRKESRKTGKPRRKTILMHRFLVGIIDPKIKIDHKNGNGLDNRKENIRIATSAQNRSNSRPQANKKYKGIYKNGNKWQARVRTNGREIYLGSFDDPKTAALAYDSAAVKYFGEFARCNFPTQEI